MGQIVSWIADYTDVKVENKVAKTDKDKSEQSTKTDLHKQLALIYPQTDGTPGLQ